MNNTNIPNPILEAIREMAKRDTDPEMRKRFLELKRKRAGETNDPKLPFQFKGN